MSILFLILLLAVAPVFAEPQAVDVQAVEAQTLDNGPAQGAGTAVINPPAQIAEAEATPSREKITVTPAELEDYPFEIVEDVFRVTDLSAGQIRLMNIQRREAKTMIARRLGMLSVRGNKDDLAVFQQLVKQRILKADQIEAWQSIGVLFGDVLVREFNMTWVRYEDRRGVNKALRWRKTDNFFFPVTMFSKRMRFGEKINFQDVFDQLANEAAKFRQLSRQPQMPTGRFNE
ncbi:MAG: DUF3806 domain-containing protein [Pseudomonadales bacterium]|nr:DUF3806 domain-containing protein [Pseudomonadales bacterium]